MWKFLTILCIAALYPCAGASAENNGAHLADGSLLNWFKIGEDLKGGEGLKAYEEAMDSLDIDVAAPAGFSIVRGGEHGNTMIFSPDPMYRSDCFNGVVGGSLLGPVYESDAKDALIAYPLALEMVGVSPDWLVETELFAANATDTLDITPLISVVKDAESANADWVIEYEYDVADPLWSSHRHCVALALRKKNHYAFPIKILFSDDGLKHKERYIDIALRSVRFGDNAKPEWIEKEAKVRADEGSFPMKKPFKCRHGK